jgi:hypothetical protein
MPVDSGNPAALGKDGRQRAKALWQQFERGSVTWPDNGEVAPVERGDPDCAMPLG